MIKLKKYFCLILSITFVISSPSAIAQETDLLTLPSVGNIRLYNQHFMSEIEDLDWIFTKSLVIYDRGPKALKQAEDWYKKMIAEEDKILLYTRAIDVANKDAIEIIIYTKYLANQNTELLEFVRLTDQIAFQKLKTLVEFIISEGYINPTLSYRQLIGPKKSNEFKNCIEYFQNRFSDDNFYKGIKKDINTYNTKVYGKMVSFFRENVKPAEIMEYAFKNGMLPKEKAGVKLVLEAKDADVSITALVKSIRGYLTQFGTKVTDIKYYPVASLTRELKSMDLAERTKYVEGLTDLQKGSQTFIKDFEKLDPYYKRYIGKNITKGFWPLAIVGAVLTANYMIDAIAENHYNKMTLKQRDLAEIGKKIEEGTANKSEKWIFFTNPISQRFVETDPVYTLNFVKLAADIYQAENFLDQIKTEEVKQQHNIENKLMDTYQKTSDILSKNPKLGIF